jgi:hypothetical protein
MFNMAHRFLERSADPVMDGVANPRNSISQKHRKVASKVLKAGKTTQVTYAHVDSAVKSGRNSLGGTD